MLLLLPWPETLRRLPQVLLGLGLFGVGVAMMVAGGLGVAPWDVFHQGVASATGASLGTVIICTGSIVVLGFLPLRERLGLGTVLNALLIGIAADATLTLLSTPEAVVGRIALTAFGPVVIGLASGLYIGGGLGPGPRDGIMTGLAKRGFAVWKVRTGLEVTVMLVGLALGGTVGMGTAWFAVSIGPIVQWSLPRFDRRGPVPPPTQGPPAARGR